MILKANYAVGGKGKQSLFSFSYCIFPQTETVYYLIPKSGFQLVLRYTFEDVLLDTIGTICLLYFTLVAISHLSNFSHTINHSQRSIFFCNCGKDIVPCAFKG